MQALEFLMKETELYKTTLKLFFLFFLPGKSPLKILSILPIKKHEKDL